MSNENPFLELFDLLTGKPDSCFSVLCGVETPYNAKAHKVSSSSDGCAAKTVCAHHCEQDYSFRTLPPIKRVLFNNPATIVFWADGTKTIVKCMEGEKFERYAGFAAACMKKLFKSTLHAKDIMEKYGVDQVRATVQSVPSERPEYIGKRADTLAIDEMAVGINHESIQEAVNEALNG